MNKRRCAPEIIRHQTKILGIGCVIRRFRGRIVKGVYVAEQAIEHDSVRGFVEIFSSPSRGSNLQAKSGQKASQRHHDRELTARPLRTYIISQRSVRAI